MIMMTRSTITTLCILTTCFMTGLVVCKKKRCQEAPNWIVDGKNPIRENAAKGNVVVLSLVAAKSKKFALHTLDALNNYGRHYSYTLQKKVKILVINGQGEKLDANLIKYFQNIEIFDTPSDSDIFKQFSGSAWDVIVYDVCARMQYHYEYPYSWLGFPFLSRAISETVTNYENNCGYCTPLSMRRATTLSDDDNMLAELVVSESDTDYLDPNSDHEPVRAHGNPILASTVNKKSTVTVTANKVKFPNEAKQYIVLRLDEFLSELKSNPTSKTTTTVDVTSEMTDFNKTTQIPEIETTSRMSETDPTTTSIPISPTTEHIYDETTHIPSSSMSINTTLDPMTENLDEEIAEENIKLKEEIENAEEMINYETTHKIEHSNTDQILLELLLQNNVPMR